MTRAGSTAPPSGARADRGVAVIMVVLVLAALLSMAGAFAMSMFLHERKARHFRDAARARLAAEGAVAHAISVLRRTDDEAEKRPGAPSPWNTPDYDTAEEFDVRFDEVKVAARKLGVKFDDPRGTIWSVRVEDEQAKINLVSAPPWVSGSRISSATITGKVAEGATVIEVDDTSMFVSDQDPKTVDGRLAVGKVAVEITYTAMTDTTLEGVQWFGTDAMHPQQYGTGTLIYDAAGVALSNAARSGSLHAVEDIRRHMSFEDYERVAPDFTLHSHRDSGTGWFQRVTVTSNFGSISESLEVTGSAGFGPGATVRLLVEGVVRDKEYLVVNAGAATAQQRPYVRLKGPVGFDRPKNVIVEIEAKQRHPVNVNTASRGVLVTCFNGVCKKGRQGVQRSEAEAIAAFVHGYVRGANSGRPCTSAGDLETMFEAYNAVATGAGTGMPSVGRDKIEALIINAREMNSIDLDLSTTPFCYKSYGDFTVEAAGVVNTPGGQESARHVVRQLVRMPVGSGGRWVLSSQKDFDEQLGRSVGRKVVSWPFMKPPTEDEDPQGNYTRGLDVRTRRDDWGYVTLGSTKVPDGTQDGFTEHFEKESSAFGRLEITHDGALLNGATPAAEASQIFKKQQNRSDVQPIQFGMWLRGGFGTTFTAGASDLNGVSLKYSAGKLVLRVADICPGQSSGAPTARGPAEFTFPWTPANAADWYHIAFRVAGTGPGDALVWVDGIPLIPERTNTSPYQPGALLNSVSGSASDLDGQTVSVNSSTNAFPAANGAILIDGEVIEYESFSGTTFAKCRRARRGTYFAEHDTDALVVPYGYSNPLVVEDLIVGGATLESNLGQNPDSQIRLPEENNPAPPPAKTPKPIPKDATELRLESTADFQDSGYVWIYDDSRRKYDIVHFARNNRGDNTLLECTRGQLNTASLNEDLPPTRVYSARQISIALTVGQGGSWEYQARRQQATSGTSGYEGNVLSRGYHYGCISAGAGSATECVRIEEVVTPGNPAGVRYILGARNTDAGVEYRFATSEWRGQLGTSFRQNLVRGDKFLPVFQVAGPQCGDEATVHEDDYVTPAQDMATESNVPRILHTHAGEFHADSNCHFVYRVVLDSFVSRKYPHANSRILKFPSGEMPRQVEGTFTVAGGSTMLDEVSCSSGGRRSAMVALPSAFPSGDAALPLSAVSSSATAIPVVSDLLMNADATPGSTSTVGTPDIPQRSLIMIGTEIIHFDSATSSSVDVPWGKAQKHTAKLHVNGHTHAKSLQVFTLNNCKRGLMGTTAREHAFGERVLFLKDFPLTRLSAGIAVGDNRLQVEDPALLPGEGYALISSADARLVPFQGEFVGWTQKSGGAYIGCEHLRGRFGTGPETGTNHDAGDFAWIIPTRYWDRYSSRGADAAETAYFAASHSARGAQWRSIEWKESGFDGRSSLANIELRVRCRFDGKPAWTEMPTNRPGGIWEFTGGMTHSFFSASGGTLVADSIDVRVYFQYKRGVYAENTNDWKRNVRLDNLIVTYGNPLIVRKVDLLDY